MSSNSVRSILISVACFALIHVVFLEANLSADMVYINSPLFEVTSVNSTEMEAKFRVSNSNWDQSLSNGNGTSAGANFLQANLGNVAQIRPVSFAMTLQHIAGEGFIFELINQTTSAASRLSWGTFSTPPGGTTATSLNGIGPGDFFNYLQIEARATWSDATQSSSMSFSSLNFSSPSLTVADGSLANGTVTPTTNGPGDSPGFWLQSLYSDTDLSMEDWTLSGVLQASRFSSGGDETVRFVITAQDVNASPASVPEPSSVLLFAIGLGGVHRLRRRTASQSA